MGFKNNKIKYKKKLTLKNRLNRRVRLAAEQ